MDSGVWPGVWITRNTYREERGTSYRSHHYQQSNTWLVHQQRGHVLTSPCCSSCSENLAREAEVGPK